METDVSRNLPAEVSRAVLHKGAKFNFEQVVFAGRDGTLLKREVVRHPGAVVILPILEVPGQPKSVVLIRNFRTATGCELWELPAGTRETGEEPAFTAARELIEETGYKSATIDELGRFYTSPGLSDELMYAYVAKGLAAVGQHLEADENITVHVVPRDEAFAMIERGEILDAKSVLTLLWAASKGLI